MPFSGHGTYNISRFSNILLLSMNGSTNLELFVEIEKELEDYRIQFGNNPWLLILDLRHWGLATPEYIEAMRKHSMTNKLEGRRCDDKIVILNSQFTHSLLLERFKDPKPNDDYVINSISEANEIVEKLGYDGSEELAKYWEKTE